MAETKGDAYLPDVAMTLNNMAILYSDTQRQGEAERAYTEALNIFRRMVKLNPDAYMFDIAKVLKNMADFYRDKNHQDKAIKLLNEYETVTAKIPNRKKFFESLHH